MTPDTERLITATDWTPHLDPIPVERLSREMLKALEKDDPARFFIRMIECDAGRGFLPEIFRMRHVPAGPDHYHPEGDLFTHSIQVLERLSERTGDAAARFCGFFHDLGKLSTDPSIYPKHRGHDAAGFETARDFCDRLRLPAAVRKALQWTCRLHMIANRWQELRDSSKIKLAEQAMKAGIGEILPLVSAADRDRDLPMEEWQKAMSIAGMTTGELGIAPVSIEAVPIADRPSFLLQKRVERWRVPWG